MHMSTFEVIGICCWRKSPSSWKLICAASVRRTLKVRGSPPLSICATNCRVVRLGAVAGNQKSAHFTGSALGQVELFGGIGNLEQRDECGSVVGNSSIPTFYSHAFKHSK